MRVQMKRGGTETRGAFAVAEKHIPHLGVLGFHSGKTQHMTDADLLRLLQRLAFGRQGVRERDLVRGQ